MPPAGRIEALEQRSPLIGRALALAREAHDGEVRETGGGEIPFVDHVTAAAGLLLEHGYEDETIAAGLLHDATEHAGVDPAKLREQFGERVAAIAAALTEDDAIEDRSARKRELRERVAAAGPDAGAVFAADKAVNVAALRGAYAKIGERVDARLPVPLDEKLLTWEHDLAMLLDQMPEAPVVERLADELLALRELRAEPRGAVS